MTNPPDYVLACLDPPSVWNFYPSMEAAAAVADEAKQEVFDSMYDNAKPPRIVKDSNQKYIDQTSPVH